MNARLKQALFAAACIAQLALPLSLVAQHEQTRASGTPWKFQTAPVDPGDPFRGRYVRLSYKVERDPVPLTDATHYYVPAGTRMYAELLAGPDGYATLVKLHPQRPESGEYIDVFVRYMRQPAKDGGKQPPAAIVHVPFDRYYLPEEKAGEVERRYGEASRKAMANTYAEVRVRAGHAALVSLVLDGKPVTP